jgi:hypothetical protein
MSTPVTPFWFKQRQCQAEPVGENVLKLTGPILPEAFIRIDRDDSGSWRAAIRTAVDGPDERTAVDLPGPKEAWEAAFELYRLHLIT